MSARSPPHEPRERDITQPHAQSTRGSAGTLRRSESSANRSARHSLLSWYNNGEPGRGQMRQHARPSSLLLRLPDPLTDSGPPSSAAVSSGHLQPREFSLLNPLPPIRCRAALCGQLRQQEEAIWSSFGAAEGQSRGSAFKGPEAPYRLKVEWSGTGGSNDMREAESMHQEIRRPLSASFLLVCLTCRILSKPSAAK